MKSRNIVYLGLLIPLISCVKPSDKKPSIGEKPNTDETSTPRTNKPGTENAGGKPTEGTPPEEPEGTVVTYPEADAELGEQIQEGELEAANQIRDIIEKQIRAKYTKNGVRSDRALRDAHPKMHGCVKAKFEVDPNIPADLSYGVLTKGAKYDAVIRYSNSSHKPTQADIVKDGRGMAMKLFGVPGKKLLDIESKATTQDFIFISHPVFFTNNPKSYVNFINSFENEDIISQGKTLVALGAKGVAIASAITSLQAPSAMQVQYFSNVPYQLGSGSTKKAVKYTVKPCGTDASNKVSASSKDYINGNFEVPKSTTDDNYLRTRLVEHFKTSDACMEMFVQVRGSNSSSVEDSMTEWTTPWTKVATIKANRADQDISTSSNLSVPSNRACDSLSFNPWHSLPEHKPLGSMNRIRKIVYEHISKLRHTINDEERKEPSSFETK